MSPIYIPGHACTLHGRFSHGSPSQGFPLCMGAGCVQFRDLCCKPVPQDLLQEFHWLQTDQPPSTVKINELTIQHSHKYCCVLRKLKHQTANSQNVFLLNGVQFSLYKKECLAWMVTFAKNTWSERWNQIDLNSDTPTCTRMSHTCLYLLCVSCTWRSTMFRLRICTSARKNLCSIATTYTTWHWHRPNRPTTVDCEKNKTS